MILTCHLQNGLLSKYLNLLFVVNSTFIAQFTQSEPMMADTSMTSLSLIIWDKSTHIPDTVGHHTILHLFLISCPEKCSVEVLTSLGTSDHSLIKVKGGVKPNVSADVPFHKIIFQYAKADWDTFRFHIVETPLSALLKNSTSRTAVLISGSSQAWLILFERNNTNRNQIPSLGSWQNVLQLKPTVAAITFSTT